MNRIIANKTYMVAAANLPKMPIESMHRVVWRDEDKDRDIAVVLRLDKKPLGAPKILSLKKLESLAESNKFILKKIAITPQSRLDDEKLAKRYPPRNGKHISAPLAYRTKWLQILDEITPHLEKVWRKEISLFNIISTAANKYSVPVNQTYQILYKFIAEGFARDSVIPDWIYCGGKGKKRVGKGFILGRMKSERKKHKLSNDNFVLTPVWLANIRDTYKETVSRGVSVEDGWSTFLVLHCSTSCVVVNGETIVTYLDRDKHPSKVQWKRHGPDGTPEEEAWRKQLENKEYEKNFRGMFGGDTPETFRTGILADVDSTSNDRYLVSVFNRLRGVGTARSLPVVDTSIGYIFGIYVGWSVNGEAAKLSILNAASDKVEFCARYGLTITHEEWYACLHAEYRADKGEFNAEVPRESLGNLNRSIEYVISGRPDLRPEGEQTHHRLHDQSADGSTYGTTKKRGQRDPAKDAHQNIFEYTRELIRHILWHNNYVIVEHLLTTEMRQCGVKPTRRAILEWSMKNGYHHQIGYSEEDLVLALCPEVEAVVTPNGVYPIVRRNGSSGDEITLDELRYLDPFIKQHRWLEIVRESGRRRRIVIRMNPNDPRKIWYQDADYGLQTFDLATKDPLLSRLATVHDLISTKTDEIGSVSQAKDEADKARATMRLQNEAERKQSKKEKKEQQVIAKKTNVDSSTGADRRKNRQDEVAAVGQSPLPVTAGTEVPVRQVSVKSNPVQNDENREDEISILMEEWLHGGQA